MDTEKALLVVGVTLVIVLIINAGILVTFLRKKGRSRMDVFGKAIQAVRDPFRDENESMSQLREKVSNLENQNLKETDHNGR